MLEIFVFDGNLVSVVLLLPNKYKGAKYCFIIILHKLLFMVGVLLLILILKKLSKIEPEILKKNFQVDPTTPGSVVMV